MSDFSAGEPSNQVFTDIPVKPTGGCFSAARLHDRCSGHGCFPPRQNNSASSNVYINGKGAHRQSDTYDSHCCGDSCHSGSLSDGSQTVFTNGLASARVTDPVSCGSMIVEGSPNVFIG